MWYWGQGHWVGHSWSWRTWVACTYFHFYHRPAKSLSPFRAFISTVSIFLERNKVKHFLSSFTHLLLCRIHELLGDSHPTVPTIGEGVEENPWFVIACTSFPGFFFHFTHLAILFSEHAHFTRLRILPFSPYPSFYSITFQQKVAVPFWIVLWSPTWAISLNIYHLEYVIWTTVRVFSKGPQQRRVGCLL